MNSNLILIAFIGAFLGVTLVCLVGFYIETMKILKETLSEMEKEIEELRQKIERRSSTKPIHPQVSSTKKQSIHQDISRFFKGKGKLASWYRKVIKQKVKTDEESL